MDTGQPPRGVLDHLLRAWLALSIVAGAWLLGFVLHV
jgi:hypothetical protein